MFPPPDRPRRRSHTYFQPAFTFAVITGQPEVRMGKTHMSDTEKGRIIEARENGYTVPEICKKFKRGKTSIFSLLKCHCAEPRGVVPPHRKIPGRPVKLSKTTMHLLKIKLTKNPFLTAFELQEMYPDLLNGVSCQPSSFASTTTSRCQSVRLLLNRW